MEVSNDPELRLLKTYILRLYLTFRKGLAFRVDDKQTRLITVMPIKRTDTSSEKNRSCIRIKVLHVI